MEKCKVWISGGLWRSLDAGWRGGVGGVVWGLGGEVNWMLEDYEE